MISEDNNTVIDSNDTLRDVPHHIVGVNGQVTLQPQVLMGLQREQFCDRIVLISVCHHYERIQDSDYWLLNSSNAVL